MTIKDLIQELQKYDENETVECLGKTTDWTSGSSPENDSVEIITCDWFEVKGVTFREEFGVTTVCIYSNEEDIED